ncbi:TetR/AcrR family transcriptional regulator [Ralstonia chuxiongensis]|uniref:TetR/AcrR family transcriptional regulator n=1 Tax=Ralstonia chuxiongensis TaxID=2957504 RepID=A0AA42BK16_9RALS|nr:TetR/AcrR family transcriptional regulator [Ralstonia chuxiongensis]MCP1172412.1 TetR/AcrR family transcriptional regulator [Ralstonia chuxiongensis]
MEKTFETADAPAKKGRPYGGVAPEARAAERRDALIRAGTRVFGTAGFRKTTVRAICQEAKLNDRYFYAAFDSTEALLRATYQQHAEDLRAQVSEATAAAEGTLEARIDAGLHAFFAFLREPCAARVLLLEVMGVSPETDATYQRNLLEFGRQIMANAQLPGAHNHEDAGPRADPRIIGLALVGALTNVGAAWLLTGYRDPEEKMVRNCRQVVLGTLRTMLGD